MQADTIVIRRASAADVPALHELLERYFNDWSVWERDSPEALLAIIEDETELGVYVAEDGGRLLGCVLSRTLDAMPGAAECKRMYVLPEQRGHGIAARLLQAAERDAAAAGFAWMYLDSKEEFAAAIRLYLREGYHPCERFNDNAQATLFFCKRLA